MVLWEQSNMMEVPCMELKNPLLAVSDLERSLAFYESVLGLRVVLDFGANKTLTDRKSVV